MARTADAATRTEKPSLTLVRQFDAPVESVWRAWTEPEALKRWFGPDAGAVSVAQTDVRVGGRFHMVFKTLDGEQHDVSGTYREVEANRRLVKRRLAFPAHQFPGRFDRVREPHAVEGLQLPDPTLTFLMTPRELGIALEDLFPPLVKPQVDGPPAEVVAPLFQNRLRTT